jgi:hypothetical protein
VILLVLAALSLFDGSSLTGWQAGNSGVWRASAGELVGDGERDSYLATDAEYGNFVLSLEFSVDAGVNSGVFIRCQQRDNIHPTTCLELNIWDQHPQQEARTGAIVFRFMPPLAKVDTLGHWNHLRVEARGPRVELAINETLTARLTDADATPGFIALQHFGSGRVRFRNIVLTLLED